LPRPMFPHPLWVIRPPLATDARAVLIEPEDGLLLARIRPVQERRLKVLLLYIHLAEKVFDGEGKRFTGWSLQYRAHVSKHGRWQGHFEGDLHVFSLFVHHICSRPGGNAAAAPAGVEQ
jgi:hypothetical protein